MARIINRLKATGLSSLGPGLHHDGDGLYLQNKNGGSSWLLRFMFDGKPREMGLGPRRRISMADAREQRKAAHELLARGVDPIAERKGRKQAARVEVAKSKTFRECAERCIETLKPEWTNAKHADQWTSTMVTYAYPTIGHLPVQAVDTGLVVQILEAIWTTKTETAVRVRMRMEKILNWATIRGYRTGDNPARWRGHLDGLLPKPRKVTPVENHPALPYAAMPEFYADLSKRNPISVAAMRFLILTSARTGAVRLATRSEVNIKNALWTVPALPGRKSYGKERLVPLSKEALAVLDKVGLSDDPNAPLFPNARGEPLDENTIRLYLQQDMKRADITPHGFRSTFRDWAGDCSAFDRETIEFAYGHKISDKAEAAYRRSTAVEKRRKLMDAWARYCTSGKAAGGKVVPLRKA